MDILQRLGTIEIVESAQRVCSTWWKVCHDPAMWRVVHLKYERDCNRMRSVLEKICRTAVDRSQGQLLKIGVKNFGKKEFLNYIAESCEEHPIVGGVAHLTFIKNEDIESVGCSCSLLKSFILNTSGCDEKLGYSPSPNDVKVLAIARSMPELRRLGLLLNTLTSVGLQAILDGCPHLVSLDLRHCNIYLVGDLGRRCRQQIVDLKQPHASSHDYEFDSEVCYYLYYWYSDDYGDYLADDDIW